MSHEHHSHQHPTSAGTFDRAFAIGVALNLAFVVAETAGGLLANSLALLADAGHNLSDVLGLLLAWGASVLSRRGPTQRRTYGLRRSSILAALTNALLLLIAVGAIVWEALQRFGNPEPVAGPLVIWLAGVGIVINTATALLFVKGHDDMNIRGAFVHMAADAAVSAGVVIAGVVMFYTGWLWVDPLMSLLIALVITLGTWNLLRNSLNLALDAVPAHINPEQVRNYLQQLPGVSQVHDLHIWGMSTTEIALTVHLVMPQAGDDDALLQRLNHELQERFAIGHCTVQIERSLHCHLAPDEIV